MTLREDLSEKTPETRPPMSEATPEAKRNEPRPPSRVSPLCWARVTMNVVDSAETNSRERTLTNCRKRRSPV